LKDGLPSSCIMTQQERQQVWDANPPKPMPSFNKVVQTDQQTLKLLAELEEAKKTKTKNRIHKMLDKKEDRTGQRWNTRTSKWEKDQPMISITTNTRGATKMVAPKDYADMNLAELAAAYNKISGKPPIKKFKDKATGLKRMAELKSKPSPVKTEAAVNGVSKLSEVVRKPKKEPKESSANKLAAEFGARVNTNRERLIIALDEHYRKMVSELDLLKAVYGSKNTENSGALGMVFKGMKTMIEKNKLPYVLKEEKNEAKEKSFGLFPK
jgi:hypothetical protein